MGQTQFETRDTVYGLQLQTVLFPTDTWKYNDGLVAYTYR